MREKTIVGLMLAVFVVAVGLAFSHMQAPPVKSAEPATDFSSLLGGLSKVAVQDSGIAIIKLYGPIQTQGPQGLFGGGEGGADGVVKVLRKHLKNDKVKAVVLRINSPGGTVGASQELHQQVMAYRKANKPLVVSVADMAASGGYYAACGATKIYANQGSLVGSIGVIMSLPSFKGLFEWAKIDYKGRVIRSGKFKDIGAAYRDMRPDEKEQLQALIDTTYEQFIGAVIEGRKEADPKVLREAAQGQIYTGVQAKELGLIDELGTLQDALAEAARLAGLDENDPPLIQKSIEENWMKVLQQFSKAAVPAASQQSPLAPVGRVIDQATSFRLEYRFHPGL